MAEPKRILVVRLSAIGDVVMASGLIPALRAIWPEARIAWLTDTVNADLLRHNPRLDQVYLWPRSHWRQLRTAGRHGIWLREAAGLIGTLRAERFDLVLDLQGLLKSGIWARLAGGSRRIGLGSREGSGWLMTEVVDRRVADASLIGSEYRKLAEHLGAPREAFALDIAVAAADRSAAAGLLRSEGIGGPFAVLCPFTTRPQKHWFDDRWANLAARLAAAGQRVLLLGGPGDRERAEAIRAAARNLPVNLAGRTSLGLCAALMADARLAVGVDTGLTHLAIASACPTLALFGSTRPYLHAGSDRAQVLYQPLECSPCRRRPTCDGRFDCMRLHTVDQVLAAANRLPP